MWQTLIHIPLEIAGLPVFGIGFLLGIWAVFSLGLMAWLAYRQGFNADTWGYVPILLLVAAVIIWLLPALCDEQGFPIHGFGFMNLLAIVTATALAVWRANRLGINPEVIYSTTFWLIVGGIIGARSFYVIQYWSTQYWPVYQIKGGWALLGAVLNISQGGLVIYGAFIGGTLGMLTFAYKNKLPLLALADLFAPSMMLGLAIGRIGCLLNGCCYGGVCHLPWAITFPPASPAYFSQIERGQMYGFRLSGDPNALPILLGVDPDSPAARAGLKPGDRLQKINDLNISTAGDAHAYLFDSYQKNQPLQIQAADRPGVELPALDDPARSLPVHPTQIYSTIDALLICIVLLAYDPFCRRDGALFALMINIYAVTRYLIEILRTDEAPISGTGMSISQNISLVLLVLVAALWFYILRRSIGRAFVRRAHSLEMAKQK